MSQGKRKRVVEGAVGFDKDPVDSFSRPANTAETRACYHFEMHARNCAACWNACEVHHSLDNLCEVGYPLAQDVARYLYQKSDGATYSTVEENDNLVRVESPARNFEVCNILRAIEHGKYRYGPRKASKIPIASAKPVRFEEKRPSPTEMSRTNLGKVGEPIFGMIVRREDAKPSSLPRPAAIARKSAADEEQPEEPRPGEMQHENVRSEEVRPLLRKPSRTNPGNMRPPFARRVIVADAPRGIQSGRSLRKDSKLNSLPRPAFHVDAESEESLRQKEATSRANTPDPRPLPIRESFHRLEEATSRTNTPDSSYRSWRESFHRLEEATNRTNTPDSSYLPRRESFHRLEEATNRTNTPDSSYLPRRESFEFGPCPSPIGFDHDDYMSVTSSDQGSVFSVASMASSATDLSKGSGYSAVQIATATREVLSIFRDHEALHPLYTIAIEGAIGPRKFVNAFRRLLKAFADRLKDEAQDRLDVLAARLVALKAREISEAILERYELGKAPELDAPEERESAFTLPDDSSDEDEHGETNVDETIFEELTNIREFLIQSAAFKLLQADLQDYLLSKRRSKKPSIVRQADLDQEEKTNGINGLQKPDSRTDAHARSTESAIENDCFEMLRHDRPLFELYLYAFRILGIDRFVDDFSDLLRHHYSNDHAPLDREVDGSIEGSIDEQLITTWQPIASAIALRLEANLAFEKDDKCGTETDTSFLLELLSREGDDLKCPAPYDNLNRDLALLICRDPLRQLLSSVPKRAIDLSERNDTSLSNKTKAFLEDYTMAEWDWWPLAPRVPDIAYGECRLHWKFGGVQLYETLSSLECNIIRFAMPSLPDHPKQCFCCHLERPGKTSSATSPQSVDRTPEPQTKPWYSSFPMAWTKAAASTAASPSHSSTASQRYTPTDPSATSATGTNSAAAGGTSTNPSAINNSNSTPQITGQPTPVPPNTIPNLSLRVLFGIQGSRWSLEVEQINITAALNDPAFFRELKARYKKHRHWIKRFISPFRFRFCRFVKLEKFDAGRVLSQGDDLPDYPGVKDDYEYDPRPGTIPMISPKTFAVCLKACDMNCRWPWLNPWHDCVSLPCRSDRLGCIPKKKSEFDIQSDDAIAVAWGLEADHAISFAFMAVYHLVPLLAAFGFWIYWLIKFPGDWQNAAVPVLTVLAIFAVLWVPFGKHLGIV